MNFAKVTLLVVLLSLLYSAAIPSKASASADGASTLFVNVHAQSIGSNIDCTHPFTNTIQNAISAANPGDTIHVCAGTYDEQLSIMKSGVTVVGDGTGLTIIKPTSLTPFVNPATGRLLAPIFLVRDASGVTLENFTVDGSQLTFSACPPFEFGILYFNAGGTVHSVKVSDIWDLPVLTCGVGIGVSSRAPNLVVIDSNILNGYNQGVRCSGAGATCIITGNTISGQGPIDYALQGGIVAFAATIDVRDNSITGHYFSPRGNIISCISVGILLFDIDPTLNPHLLELNTFANNELNVQRAFSFQPGVPEQVTCH